MKCKICEHEFKLRNKNKYIVERTEHHIFGGTFTSFYDCFDCPVCGCQNMVNKHIENIKIENIKIENFEVESCLQSPIFDAEEQCYKG